MIRLFKLSLILAQPHIYEVYMKSLIKEMLAIHHVANWCRTSMLCSARFNCHAGTHTQNNHCIYIYIYKKWDIYGVIVVLEKFSKQT